MADNYDEKSIQVHAGLKGVRMRPQMYIGTTDSSGIVHLCKEVGDNCADEHGVGRASACKILVDDKTIYVVDDGAGFPVKNITFENDSGDKVTEPAIVAMVSRLHAGGKFTDSAYKVSGGVHGVGIKAVNALSDYFRVTTHRDGQWYTLSFNKGKLVEKLAKCSAPKLPHGHKCFKTGTVVEFTPDYSIFEKGAKFDAKQAASWSDITAYLHGGMTITLNVNGKEKTYVHKNGVQDYVDAKIKELGCNLVSDKLFLINHSHVDCAIQFTDAEGDQIRAFTSGISNPDGGEHIRALWAALSKALTPYQKRGQDFGSVELREGTVGLLNYKINAPRFNSQTKEKLVDERVYADALPLLTEAFENFFKKNKQLAADLCERASNLRAAKQEANSLLKSMKSLKPSATGKKAAVPDKLSDCDPKTSPEDAELYIVEGDSAGGSAKQGRYQKYQAILPLKGKPLNAMKNDDAKVLASEEVANILLALRYNPMLKDPVSNIRYNTIILLSDSDDDGRHINLLVLGLLQKYIPGLFTRGWVYVLDSKNCKYFGRSTKNEYVFGSSVSDVEQKAAKKKIKLVGKVTYLKGWGELNPDGLRYAAMDKESRSLIRIDPLNKKQTAEHVGLLGEDTEARKTLMGI